jgi:hypothetical protein
VLVAVVVVVIAAVAIIPLIMDVRRATAWRQQITDRLIDRADDSQEVRDLLRDLREPRGVRGLTRSVIAILILALVGFALAVAMLSSGADSGDLRKTIVTSLMTVLATVAGFYFGTLGAQNSAEDARRAASPPKKHPAAPPGGPDLAAAPAPTPAAGPAASAADPAAGSPPPLPAPPGRSAPGDPTDPAA